MKNYSQRLHNLVYKYRKYIVGTAISGVILSSLIIQVGVLGNPWGESAYETVQLFVMGSDTSLVPPSAPVWASTMMWALRFLAPALAATGLWGVVAERWLNRPFLYFHRGHVVVAGLGQVGASICEAFVAHKDIPAGVVAIECDEDNPRIDHLRDRGVTVIIGDVIDPRILERARVAQAKYFISTVHSDILNIEAGIAAVQLARASSDAQMRVNQEDRALQIGVHIAECDLRSSFERSQGPALPAIRSFSVYKRVAERLLQDHYSAHWSDPDVDDLVVIAGLGRLGRSVVNGFFERGFKGLRIWAVDPALDGARPADLLTEQQLQKIQAEVKTSGMSPREELEAANKAIEGYLRIFPTEMMDRILWAELLGERNQGTHISFFICTDNDVENASFAERISVIFGDKIETDQRIVVITRLYRRYPHLEGAPGLGLGGKVEYRQFIFRDETYRLFASSPPELFPEVFNDGSSPRVEEERGVLSGDGSIGVDDDDMGRR